MKTMKSFFITITTFLIILNMRFVLADSFNPQEIGYVKARITIESDITSTGFVDELNQTIYAVPQEYKYIDVEGPQKYLISTDDTGNKKITLEWKKFQSGSYEISYIVENYAYFSSVRDVKYPYIADKEYWKYLKESKNIIITPEIRVTAKKIVSNSNNSFEAIGRISNWINSNLEYDTNYSDVSLSSDKVFEVKRGTCDEFTNLFIAMARSLGIPARYVSGITYSEGSWGYHAWAEVYLNEWVPVDPTWNEVGWTDATHIKLGSFVDSSEVKVKTTYLSDDPVKIISKQPEISVNMIDFKKTENKISINISSYPSEIGLKKSSVLTIELNSNLKGCVGVPIKLIPNIDSSGIPIVNVTPKSIFSIVCPNEDEIKNVMVTSPRNLKKGYVYYNLIDIYSPLGNRSVADLKIDPNLNEMCIPKVIISKQMTAPGKIIKFSVTCKKGYKVYSDLPIKDGEIIASTPGSHYLIVISSTGDMIKKEILVRNDLEFEVENISIPEESSCGKKFNVSLSIKAFKGTDLNISIEAYGDLNASGKYESYIGAGESKRITIPISVNENCTEGEKLIKISINNQPVVEEIMIRKPVEYDFFDNILNFLKHLIEELSSKIESI